MDRKPGKMDLSSASDIRSILIRSANWIGDAVMTTPAMEMVRKTFPHAQITVVANPVVAELFRHHPYCDRVLPFKKKGEHRGIAGLWRFSRTLQAQGFDLGVLFQNAIEAAILARLAGIPARAGYATDGRGWLLTHRVSVHAAVRRLHHTDYYQDMLGRLGFARGSGKLRLSCLEEEKAWADGMLGTGTRVAVHPGAAYGSAKRWLPERFAAVADHLSASKEASIVLTGGPGEAEIGGRIQSLSRANVRNLVGKTSVRELMAVLSRCRMMITNDSGPMHVAAALNVPVVALFGSTDPSTTAPHTPWRRIVHKETECAPCLLRRCPRDHRCMDAIGVEDVVEAAESLWEETA